MIMGGFAKFLVVVKRDPKYTVLGSHEENYIQIPLREGRYFTWPS